MTEGRRHEHVANVTEIDGTSSSAGTRFASTRKRLGVATGARAIGCSWYQVPPGRTAFPRHFHCANEEAIYVLEGEGMLHVGTDDVALRSGDYVTVPVGPGYAHELANTGAGVLTYLCLSTMLPTEVVGYPDSKKVLALATAPPDAVRGEPWIRLFAFEASNIGYYDGEAIEQRNDDDGK